MRSIVRLDNKNESLWEEYLKKNQETRIQHSLKFRDVVKETYKNCEDFYFLYKEEKVLGIFPFIFVKSRIFGNRLICVPFLDVGGFSGNYNLSTLKSLMEEIKKSMKNLEGIEIRLNTSLEGFSQLKETLLALDFSEKRDKHQFIVFPTSIEDMWKRFHKHTRNDIRKAQKSGLEIREIKSKPELKKFYRLYMKEMANFGTPQHSYKFFEKLFEIFDEKFTGFNCYYKNNLAGGLILYNNNGHAYISFNVSDQSFREYRPNDLLYWTAIKLLIGKGVKDIDLGQVEINSSKGSHAYGLYKFKSKWLGELHERVYFRWPKGEDEKGNKEKYKRFRNVWKRIPGLIIKKIGPKICAQLGI